jgi:hypothetical protein
MNLTDASRRQPSAQAGLRQVRVATISEETRSIVTVSLTQMDNRVGRDP